MVEPPPGCVVGDGHGRRWRIEMTKFMVTVFAFGISACALDTGDQPEQQGLDEWQVTSSLDDVAIAKAKAVAMVRAEPVTEDMSVDPRSAACGRAPSVSTGLFVPDAPRADAANQRNGTTALSSTNCTIVGVLQPTDDAVYFCWTPASDGTWTYARNVRTNVQGWTRDDLLDRNGSGTRCPPPF
jgi:hypothetical protein